MKRLGGTNATRGNDHGHGDNAMTLAGAGVSAPKRLLSRFVSEARSVLSSLAQRNALVDAGAMAFALFLASIPLMGLAGAVVAHVLRGDAHALSMLSSLVDVAPDEVRELVDRYVARGTGQGVAPVFLLGSLWLAAGAFHDAMTVFESALDAVPRTWLHKRLIALACVVSLLSLLAVLGSSVVVLLGGPLELLASLVQQGVPRTAGVVVPTLVAAGTLPLLAAFFRVAVRHRSRTPVIWRGAIATVAIGSVASYAFARYARTLARYTVFYGSLAAVAVFLVWLWLCCIALLIGVETNAEAERRRHSVEATGMQGSG